MSSSIPEAEQQLAAAQEGMREAILEAFPIGCRVMANLGRSCIVGEVVDAGRYARCKELYIRNVASNATRTCFPTLESNAVQRVGVVREPA